MNTVGSLEEFLKNHPPKYNLYYPANEGGLANTRPCDLFIRILSEHVSCLYAGTKTYELRKYVPLHTGWVFLFDTDGMQAVTGCFFFKDCIVQPISELWLTVGEKATSKDIFDSYFSSKKFGVALKIERVLQADHPIYQDELYEKFPDLPPPPEPFVYLYSPVGSKFSTFLRSRFSGAF